MEHENDYGWAAHVDRRGTPCGYCGAPSTATLILEGDQYRNGELARRGKRVGLCDEHNREAEPVAAFMSFRRRHDKAAKAQQMALDVGDGHGRHGAIYGDEAA